MAELNKVLMIGRLTKDPEIRFTPSGTKVAEFRLAVNHTYRTRDGEKREETCFLDVSVMGRSADTVENYLTKGREVFVEGRLQFNTWETQNGEKRSKHRMVADRFQFLGGRGTGRGPDEDAYEERSSSHQAVADSGGSEEDDLPF
jgi:single-strand DNA-binding protein